jgi:hypothetical protein
MQSSVPGRIVQRLGSPSHRMQVQLGSSSVVRGHAAAVASITRDVCMRAKRTGGSTTQPRQIPVGMLHIPALSCLLAVQYMAQPGACMSKGKLAKPMPVWAAAGIERMCISTSQARVHRVAALPRQHCLQQHVHACRGLEYSMGGRGVGKHLCDCPPWHAPQQDTLQQCQQ